MSEACNRFATGELKKRKPAIVSRALVFMEAKDLAFSAFFALEVAARWFGKAAGLAAAEFAAWLASARKIAAWLITKAAFTTWLVTEGALAAGLVSEISAWTFSVEGWLVTEVSTRFVTVRFVIVPWLAITTWLVGEIAAWTLAACLSWLVALVTPWLFTAWFTTGLVTKVAAWLVA